MDLIPGRPGTKEYGRVHEKLYKIRGKAKNYTCQCGKPAQCWSWTHDTDPLNIYNYRARCYKCHNDYDRPADLSEKISATLIGNTRRVGTKATAETRKKLSAAKIGNTNRVGTKASPETRRKLSNAKIGNLNSQYRGSDSPEVRAKKSAGMKASWARRKANGNI